MRFKLALICMLISQSGWSQRTIPRFETLSSNDGLPHSSVYGIRQDKKGFMWFGTPDGLCRYDGSSLHTFRYQAKSDTDAVNNFIRGSFFEDKQGNIWYSNESGIFKWNVFTENVDRVKAFGKNDFGNSNFICQFMDEHDNLIILNIIKGVFEFDTHTYKLKLYPLPYKIDFSQVSFAQNSADDEGNVWVRLVGKNDPYIFFNRKTHRYAYRLQKYPPQSVFFEKNRHILAFDDRIIFRDLKTGRDTTIFKTIDGKPAPFYSVQNTRDKYGREWFTSRGNGLFYYNEKTGQFYNYHHDNSKLKSLPFDISTCLYIDRGDNLWIGIDGGGVSRLDLKEPKFNLFPLSEGDYPILKDYFTKCFFEDDAGNIWFGTHNSGLNIYNQLTGALKNFQHKDGDDTTLPGNIVSSFLKDKDGNMWVGSSGGISLFDMKKQTFRTIPIIHQPKIFPKLNVFIFKLIQLHDGDILAATLLGLVRLHKDGQGNFTARYLDKYPYLQSNIIDVVEMPDKSIYAAISSIGLFHAKPDGEMYRPFETLLPGIDLRSVRHDEKDAGWLWIGSGMGLIHFNTATNKYQIWGEKSKLPNTYVYGSLEDENHNLWISTNKGLSFFNRTDNTFENYSFLDGLQSNEFNTQSFYKSKTGTFYFGGIKGFNWFKPVNSLKNLLKPGAAITRIEINGEAFLKTSPHFKNQEITVPYSKNDFNIQFAALDYTRPEANKVQYILQNWDSKPVITYGKSVRYSHLLPGNYVFKLKAANTYGVWSDEEKVFIHITAPYWQRAWFYVAGVVLVLGIIVYITYMLSQVKIKRRLVELEKIQAIDAERNRISRDMHDEIGSGLTHIALLSELIQTHQEAELSIKTDVNSISAAARRLLESINEIIWALNPQNDTLESLLAYTREQMQQHFQPFALKLQIDFPDEVPYIKLTNEQRRNLYLVTKEALNNVMKHANATSAELGCRVNGGKIEFTVKDNGGGLPEKAAKVTCNGLKNMLKRMEDIGGDVKWLSDKQGVTVIYTFTAG
ncbi:ligand-binding sensor domain-containing protein [Mucilaginibacter flavidus]|uniref:ligand-binding sensor domain-containing protein n=1 Tax=Mucilaginibacter flavidus TaxID=2949309 RepID=UPI00209207EE|nr:sensor histidine kinase [Mucilaginibacter flavidus]MCO5948374.1 histidine kinase [Mucilaginibacter flavidus]